MEKKNEFKWISVRVSADEKDRISAFSKANGINVSALLRSYLMSVVDKKTQY